MSVTSDKAQCNVCRLSALCLPFGVGGMMSRMSYCDSCGCAYLTDVTYKYDPKDRGVALNWDCEILNEILKIKAEMNWRCPYCVEEEQRVEEIKSWQVREG